MSYTLITGDCIEAMASMQEGSVDAVVTDPPYGLEFMGMAWDTMREGGTPRTRNEWGDFGSREPARTSAERPRIDRKKGIALYEFTLAWAAEAYRVLKPGGRLLAFGSNRTHHRIWAGIEDAGFGIEDTIMWLYGSGFPKHRSKLKPAYEPVCVARKGPVSELNIDECRVVGSAAGGYWSGEDGHTGTRNVLGATIKGGVRTEAGEGMVGRWPANVMLDEEAVRLLDEQSGYTVDGVAGPHSGGVRRFLRDDEAARGTGSTGGFGSGGGASRFFYIAKASRAEREEGLYSDAPRAPGGSNAKGFTDDVANGNDRNRPVANHHPTVKPVALMRELVRLVTPNGGTVLDPFTGSGTTGVACIQEGREFIGCELNPEYVEIARRRIDHAIRSHQPTLWTGTER